MAHVSIKAIFVTSLLVSLLAAKGKLQSNLWRYGACSVVNTSDMSRETKHVLVRTHCGD